MVHYNDGVYNSLLPILPCRLISFCPMTLFRDYLTLALCLPGELPSLHSGVGHEVKIASQWQT